MALIDKVRVIKLLLFALFMMVSMVTPAQSQVDWSIKAGIGIQVGASADLINISDRCV